jgi:hypothetical protein
MHEHSHEHPHSHEHAHEHAHEHTHIHSHEHDHDHDHDHTHDHSHDHHHENSQEHSHDSLLTSKEEAAAFLSYTLSHNAHHEDEMSGLVHSLQHLGLEKEAAEAAQCIDDIRRANKRLEAVLAALK